MNAEFQRIARRDKKGFLSDQYKKIEEKSRMAETRDLFKKNTNIATQAAILKNAKLNTRTTKET